MIQLAQWDTDHFGMKIGDLVIDGEINKEVFEHEILLARNEGYKLLYLKDVTLPPDCLSQNVFLADRKVTYVKKLASESNYNNLKVVSGLNRPLDANLLSIALQSGGHSRYYLDKKFPISAFLTLYYQWIQKSLDGTLATDVLLYEIDNVPQGLITYKQLDDKVSIGLVAVDVKYKGKGIGSDLMRALFSILKPGITVEVATQQDNSEACHFYEKNGFSVESVYNIYHIWLC